jgi:lysophospholipase L1-like esterase
MVTAAIVASALIIGLVLYFAVLLPRQREKAALEQAIQQYRQDKLAQYQAENDAYADYEVGVAFLGDSLTDGYDLATYYPQYITANRGIGGDTTYDLEARLSESVYELSPRVVVMLIGANNLKTMLENYENILIGLKENLPDTKVVLVSLTSMGGSWAYNNQLAAFNNVTIKKLAEKYSFTFVDLYTPLFDETRGEIYPHYTTDGGHLTPLGYTVFTEQLTPVLEELLSED